MYNEVEELYLGLRNAIAENRVSDAIALGRSILEIEPAYALAHIELARIYNEYFKDTRRAIEHYELALRFEPDRQFAYNELAWLYLESREMDRLEALLERGMRLAPSEEVNLLRIRGIYAESLGNFREALRFYRSSRKLAGNIEFIGILKLDEERLRSKAGRMRSLILF